MWVCAAHACRWCGVSRLVVLQCEKSDSIAGYMYAKKATYTQNLECNPPVLLHNPRRRLR